MKQASLLFTCISAFLLISCGGNVTYNEVDVDREIDIPEPAVQSQPYRCGEWKMDKQFNQLTIDGLPIQVVYGANKAKSLLVTIASTKKPALALHDGESWSVVDLPSDIDSALKLCQTTSDEVYMAVTKKDMSAELLVSTGQDWQTALQMNQLAFIRNVWAAENVVLAMGNSPVNEQIIVSNDKGMWQVNELPDLNFSYTLYGFGSVGDSYFAMGYFDFEQGSPERALLLSRSKRNLSWNKVTLPDDAYMIGAVHGYSMDTLWFAAQTKDKTAVIYRADDHLTAWDQLIENQDLGAFTNIWSHENGTVVAVGKTETQHSTQGSYIDTWGSDFYPDAQVHGELESHSGYPQESWYEASSKRLYLLTDKDLYYRYCP
jgi:hypothetical protein